MRSREVFIHRWGHGVFLFPLRNLAAGSWWYAPKVILGLINFSLSHDSLGQNSSDFGCLFYKFIVSGGFFFLVVLQ